MNASIENTAIGRVVIPPGVPEGFTLFYTTIDFDGRIDERIREFVSPAALFSCRQVHGSRVGAAVPGRPAAGEAPAATLDEPECDALWSDRKGTALAIKVADCLPVSLIDPLHGVIVNIHSGWRGTLRGITTAALDAAPLDPASSIAFLGPSIGVCCFEVGEEVAAQFDPRFVDRTRGAKPHVDLAALTVSVLRERGFCQEAIVETAMCTKCGCAVSELRGLEVETAARPRSREAWQPLFHSYRRDKRSGNNLAVVAQ